MASDESALFSREGLLGGLSARRATTLLFAIENRAAHVAAQSPRAVPIVLSEHAARRRERAFLEALAQGRDAPVQATIQDLERYAPEWADLVPDDAGMRAGVAHLLGSKHAFTSAAVPQLRSALGLDTDAVRDAYEDLYGTPLATIFAPRARLAERLRWAASRLAARLDALPAFWLAFFVTLIIGAVNLALPIAVAGVGALPGIALIIVLGIINVATIAAMVEVVTRSGSVRYGNAFIGTVVADYLGNVSSAILSAVLTVFSFGLLLIFYVGISTTLADATALPAAAWMIVLFLVGLYFLTRGSLNATVASTIVITTINVGLLVVLSALALPHVRLENLSYVNLPWSPGGSFSPILLGALIGIVLDIYAAHILVAIFGKMLLQRDPSGRSVVRGHAAGIGFAMLLNIVWVLAICGAVAPEVLARSAEHGAGSPGSRSRPPRAGAGRHLRHPQHGPGPDPVLAGALQPGPRAHRPAILVGRIARSVPALSGPRDPGPPGRRVDGAHRNGLIRRDPRLPRGHGPLAHERHLSDAAPGCEPPEG